MVYLFVCIFVSTKKEKTMKKANVKFAAPKGDNFKTSHRKENSSFKEFAAICKTSKSGFETPVVLRYYFTKSGSSNSACIWVNCVKANIHTDGSGVAGGWGYHRPSAAAAIAIKNAGFDIGFAIDGRGDSAIEEAILAICEFLGYKQQSVYIHMAHN